MPPWYFLDLLSEPFARDAPLKLDGEKAVISSRQDLNGDVGPALEAAGLAVEPFDGGFLVRDPWQLAVVFGS